MIYKINNREVDKETWDTSEEDGIHQRFYQTGALECERPFVNGKLHGIEKLYHQSGPLWVGTPHVNGKIQGIQKYYYEDGTLECERPWVNDKRHGIEKWYHQDQTIESQDLWVNGEELGPLEDILKEKGKLWFLITFGPEILKKVLEHQRG